uniref:Uncharacterized protein n=1 Tax=Anguilla anguilla TaxID=7936 RepID=A0A0E9VS04_ANGAN
MATHLRWVSRRTGKKPNHVTQSYFMGVPKLYIAI